MPGLNLVRIYMYYGNTFDLITSAVIVKQFCRSRTKDNSVYFTSKQIVPFGFSGQNCDRVPLISLIFPMTQCVFRLIEAFITVAAKCWRHWPKILQSLGLRQVFNLACFAT